MPTDKAHPIPLAPYPRTDADLRVQLHAHLEVSLEGGFRNRKGPRPAAVTLEPINHGLVVALFCAAWGFGLRGVRGRAVDGFVQDRVVRVVLFHGVQVGGTFEEVDALARGVFCADGLAVDALGGEALVVASASVL